MPAGVCKDIQMRAFGLQGWYGYRSICLERVKTMFGFDWRCEMLFDVIADGSWVEM